MWEKLPFWPLTIPARIAYQNEKWYAIQRNGIPTRRNAIVGYLKVGISYLHVATVREVSTRGCRCLGREFESSQLSRLQSEVILTSAAFSAPVFRHDRRRPIVSAEAHGRRWQRPPQPSNRGHLAAGSSDVRAVPDRSYHRSSPEIRAAIRACRIDHEESRSK